MKTIAFLGLGAMGRRMAARLLDAGHRVVVWNRSADRADPLLAAGAEWAETPAAAVGGVDIAISMLRDDVASSSVWLSAENGALSNMPASAVGIECSTLSLGQVSQLASAFADRGIAFVDAPVAGSRPQAEAGQLIFMAGGDDRTLGRVQGVLDVMGGKVLRAGNTGAGMAAKLLVNGMFGVQLAVLAELLAALQSFGLDVAVLLDVLAKTPVCSPAAEAGGRAMLAGQWSPAFPIELVAKDFDLVAASFDLAGDRPSMLTAARWLYADACRAGYGQDNITGIIQRF